MTKERPIPFMADMVRAERAGIKTMTRRIAKLPHQNPLGEWQATTIGGPAGGRTAAGLTIPEQGAIWHTRTGDMITCPKGGPGDRLWVREHYRVCDGLDAKPPRDLCPAARLWYEADAPHQTGFGKFRPGMFMCRWMSRITLEIVSVRVERLQDITRGDCMAEGCPFPNMARQTDPKQWYAELWDSINQSGRPTLPTNPASKRYARVQRWLETHPDTMSWAANPWVWAIEFKRVKP